MTREELLKHLRDALHHLCDPTRLRQNALADLFGFKGRIDAFSALQQVLIETIHSLDPGPGEPPQSHARRIYECLLYRYVQQFTPQEVAEQLGIGDRQFRREQNSAIEALADKLWQRFGDQAAARAESASFSTAELAWLTEAHPSGLTKSRDTVQSTVDLVASLAAQHSVEVAVDLPAELPDIAAHPTAVTQALLELLTVAVQSAPHTRIEMTVRAQPGVINIHIRAGAPPAQKFGPKLKMARQLVELCRGQLTVADDNTAFEATLTLPTANPVTVLILDDNADALQLMQRYAAGTDYRCFGTRDPETILADVQRLSPGILVLDVMMPQVDGWRVLSRLRQHPLTEHLPIVVCTILAQEDLALSLGATVFLHKPVRRPMFLAALDQAAMATMTAQRTESR